MNKIKFKSIAKIMLVISLVIFTFNGQVVASARAGGGSSHSSSSSSGSSSSSSGISSGSKNSDNSLLSKIERIISKIVGTIFGIGFAGFIIGGAISKVKLRKKKKKSVSAIKKLSQSDYKWDYEVIKKGVEEAFYVIQSAWMERDQDLAKQYMSEKLYLKHKEQTDEMIKKKEKNILENMKLLKITPIGVKEKKEKAESSLWFYIEAQSIDYKINEETNQIIEGSKTDRPIFNEYWKFVRADGRWVADEIAQAKDFEGLDFFTVETN